LRIKDKNISNIIGPTSSARRYYGSAASVVEEVKSNANDAILIVDLPVVL
jgi:hypothetical protein